MTWGVVAGTVGAAVVGGGIAADGSRKASNAQRDAAGQATQLSADQYNSTVERNAPFVQGGTTAFNALLQRLGLSGDRNAADFGTFGQAATFDGGPAFQAPTAEQVMAEPGYQFGLQQGQNALARQGAARGTNYSGAALAEAARYAGDYATGRYGDAFNRSMGAQQQGFNQRFNAFNANQGAQQQAYNQLAGPIGFGQAAANNTASAGQQFASTAGNNLMGAANAAGANAIAQGNIWGNVLNQGVSAYNNRPGQSSYGNTSSFRWDDPYRNPGYFGGGEGE